MGNNVRKIKEGDKNEREEVKSGLEHQEDGEEERERVYMFNMK